MTVAAAPTLRANRDYVLLWLGQTLSLVGSALGWVAYPLLVLSLTGSAAKAGIVTFANWIPYVIFQLPAGALVDRWNRKATMVVCDALRAAALGSIAVTLPLGHLTLAQIIVVAFVERTLTIFFSPAEAAALTRIVPPEQLSDAVARNDAREHTASLLGPPLGGVLFGVARFLPVAVDAASYFISLASVVALRTPFAAEPVAGRPRLRAEVVEGIRFIWRIPFLRASALQAMGTNVAWTAMTLSMIVVARRHGASGSEVGVMLALLGVGGLLGTAVSGLILRRVPPPVLVIGSVWYWGGLAALLVTTANPFLLGSIAGALWLIGPAWNGAVGGLRLRLTPDRLQGRVHAVESLLSFAARPFGLLATGYLLDGIGGRATLGLIAGWMLAIAFVSTLSPSLRRLPTIA